MIINELKKVSCLMVTTGRLECIKKSVACYMRQTYSRKELVVICQGNDETNEDVRIYLDSLGRNDIQFVGAPLDLSLGAMRNLSLEISKGQIVCQWDDDDLYHPSRIVTQYKALMENPAHVASCYTKFFKSFVPSHEMYWVDWSKEIPDSHKYLCGSIMFPKEQFYNHFNMLYPEFGGQSSTEEDLNVLEKLMMCGEIAGVSEPQYIYVYHGSNTYDLDHHKMTINTKVSQKSLAGRDEILANEKQLRQLFAVVGIVDSFVMKSQTDDIFVFGGQS